MADSNSNPNIDLATAAAAAVDPNSHQQQDIIKRATYVQGQSYADRLAGKAALAPETDNAFLAGLERANLAKAGLEAPPEVEENGAPAETPTPGAPRKLTDPPVAPRQRSNFRILEKERDTLRAELKALKGGAPSPALATAAAAAAPPDSSVLLTIQKELEEARSELALLDITRSPEFSAKFENPRAITIKQARNIAGSKGADVEAALAMPPGSLRDQKLDELLKELPASTAAIVNAANNKLASLEFEKQVEIESQRATAGERYKSRELKAQREAALRSAEFDSLLNEWRPSIEALDPSKSKEASSVIQQARTFFDGKLPPREHAAMALQSALVPGLLAEQNELALEVERLQKQLSRFTNGLPGGGSAMPDLDEPATPNTPEQRSKDFLGGLQKAIKADPTFGAVRRAQGY